MSPKIVLINQPFISNFCRNQRFPARTRTRIFRAPDWLAYATAVLEKDGLNAKLLDFPAMGWDKEKFIKILKDEKPDFTVLDSTTPSIYSDIEYAKLVKRFTGAKVIMVGTHATAFPQEVISLSEGAVDIVAMGEYDYTIKDIITHFDCLSEVAGIVYRKNGEIRFTNKRPLIENLDELPFPAWHHLDIMRYFNATWLYPHIDLIGGRGCPYQCIFCQWPKLMFGNKYRIRSAKNIVDEMEYDLCIFPQLKKGEFFFEDDTFIINKERVYSICEEIMKRNLNITWSANTRVDIYDLDLFKSMKKSGCRQLTVGFETGVQKIMDNIKKDTNIEESRQFVDTAKRAKLVIHGCFILGLPGETKETIQKTLDFARGLDLDTVQFSAAVPFPGTEYYDYCQRQGLLKAKTWEDWLYRGEQGAVVDYPDLSAEEINDYADKGLRSFYFSLSYLIKFIFGTKGYFDFYRKIRGAWNFLSHSIARKN